MNRSPTSRIVTALASIGIGVGFALFGLATDLIDRTIPIQGRPSFESAAPAAWFRASLLRFLCGLALGLAWVAWQRLGPGLRRRWSGYLLCFIGAALLRGSLGAWLNAPVEHLAISAGLGSLIGSVTFAIAELGHLLQDPPPPARLG